WPAPAARRDRAAARVDAHRAADPAHPLESGAVAVGRRAPPGRDRPGAGGRAPLHPARRALRRRGPDRGDRNPANRAISQGKANRGADYGPQRPRDSWHLRPRVYRQGWYRSCLWSPRRGRPERGRPTLLPGRALLDVAAGSALRSPGEAPAAPATMKPSLQLKLSQHLALTPQLQQSIRLLQLSTLELNQELEQIIAENPLLERLDDPLQSCVQIAPNGGLDGMAPVSA